MERSVQFELYVLKILRRGSLSPHNTEFSHFILESFSKPQTATATRMSSNVRVNEQHNSCARASLCISLQSSANNNVRWLSSPYFRERERHWLIFRFFLWKWTLLLHISPEQALRPIGVLNKSTRLRHWKVKLFIRYCPRHPYLRC